MSSENTLHFICCLNAKVFEFSTAGVTLPGEQTFLSTVADIRMCSLEKTPTSLPTEPQFGP